MSAKELFKGIDPSFYSWRRGTRRWVKRQASKLRRRKAKRDST